MAVLPGVEIVSLSIHATACNNRCRHCWVPGAPGKRAMLYEQVALALEQLAALRDMGLGVMPFLYDEPSLHPRYVDLVERMGGLGLLHEDFFLPTNGSVLARADDDTWQRLWAAGLAWLQVTLYGLESTHDEFAGRPGAFRDAVGTVRQATRHGLGVSVPVVLHRGDVSEVVETLAFARSLGPAEQVQVGYIPFYWQGRGRDCPRPRAAEYDSLPADLHRERFVSEADAVRRIAADDGLASRRVHNGSCSMLALEVGSDLEIFVGGFCDSGGLLGLVPELRPVFALGRLDEAGLTAAIERYLQQLPWPVTALGQVTWGELARRHGDSGNDEVYWLDDLPQYKWAAAYLADALKQRGTTL